MLVRAARPARRDHARRRGRRAGLLPAQRQDRDSGRPGERRRRRPRRRARDLPVRQFTAQEVKLAVTGYGAASKAQVQGMVARLCGLGEVPQPRRRRRRPRPGDHLFHDRAQSSGATHGGARDRLAPRARCRTHRQAARSSLDVARRGLRGARRVARRLPRRRRRRALRLHRGARRRDRALRLSHLRGPRVLRAAARDPGRRSLDRAGGAAHDVDRRARARRSRTTTPSAIAHDPRHRPQDREPHRARTARASSSLPDVVADGQRRRATSDIEDALRGARLQRARRSVDALERRRRCPTTRPWRCARRCNCLRRTMTPPRRSTSSSWRASVVAPVADEQERRGSRRRCDRRRWREFVGQRELVRHLEIVLGSARARGPDRRPPPLRRPAGPGQDVAREHRGRTRWARVFASRRVRCSSRPGDLAALLTDLHDGDVLFIDEIHRLSRGGRGGPLSRRWRIGAST